MNNVLLAKKMKVLKNIAKKIKYYKEKKNKETENYLLYKNELEQIEKHIEIIESKYNIYNYYQNKKRKNKRVFNKLIDIILITIYHSIIIYLSINNFIYCIFPILITILIDTALIKEVLITNYKAKKKELEYIKDFDINKYNEEKYNLNLKKDFVNKLTIDSIDEILSIIDNIQESQNKLNNYTLNNNYNISKINYKSKKRVLTKSTKY